MSGMQETKNDWVAWYEANADIALDGGVTQR